MRPDSTNYLRNYGYGTFFGELGENNEPRGRGIRIDDDGFIRIGYFVNGRLIGHYIYIWSDGVFQVGEIYMRDGMECYRRT